MSLQALTHVRERSMAEKDRRIADIEKQIWNEIEDAKAQRRREQAENASPRYRACMCEQLVHPRQHHHCIKPFHVRQPVWGLAGMEAKLRLDPQSRHVTTVRSRASDV